MADVAVSGNFMGWIIGIGGVKIVGPASVVEQMDRLNENYNIVKSYKSYIDRIKESYKNYGGKGDLCKKIKISSSTMAKRTHEEMVAMPVLEKNMCRIGMQYRRYYGFYRA